jgi:hypothetical protein
MAGTVIADKVQAASTSTLEIMNGVALTPPRIEDVNGVEIGTFCRAWVNFDGTGTFSPNPSTTKIRASFNVSSITDNGTGDYTVNFTNAMPDANLSVSVMQSFNLTGAPNPGYGSSAYAVNTTSCRISVWGSISGNRLDVESCSVQVFR